MKKTFLDIAKKRALLIAFIAISMLSAFFIWNSKAKKHKVVSANIDFWSFPNFTSDSNSEGGFEKSLIAAFEKKYPSIKINYKLLSFNDGTAAVEDAVSKGTPPDIVYDAPGRIMLWANSGLLEPLDRILASEKPYITIGLLSVSAGKDRRTYMYPMHEGAFSMAFNKEMLEDLGLLELLPYTRKDRCWTVEEYTTLLRALKEKLPPEKTPGVFYYKTIGGDQGTRAFLVNLYGNANLLNGDYSKYIFNSPQAAKNLTWTVNALKEGLFTDGADLTSNDAIAMFTKSEAAHTILYSPQLNKMYDGKRIYKGKDFTPIYMPFPNDTGMPSLEFLAGGACIFKSGNPDKVKAAELFVKFMATDETWAGKLVAATGGFPATSKIQIESEDPEILYNAVLQRFFGQYYNNIPGFSKMRGYWNTAVREAAAGKNVQKVLDTFVANADSSFKE